MWDSLSNILFPVWDHADDIFVSTALLIVVSILASWVYTFIHHYLGKSVFFAESIYFFIVLVFVIMVAAQLFGKGTADYLLSGIGIGVGYAFQPYLVAVFNGIILHVEKMFKKGNDVKIYGAGIRGNVVSVGIFYTTLKGSEGELIYVPNQVFDTNSFSVR